MGNTLRSSGTSAVTATSSTQRQEERQRRKRSLETDPQNEEEVEELSPRRRKIVATSTYIYETLFKRGVNSDVTIIALGKEWKLHKLYLCQSSYFASMFSGNWRESSESQVTLNIPDPHITVEALDTAFSSLYRDDVHLTSKHILPTVAAANMLQMDGLLQHCREFIKTTMKPDHVIQYLSAASLYGMSDLEEECRQWLELHLLKSYTIALLRDMTMDLLIELLKSPDLYVMQVEMDVYTLAKRWLYLSLHPEWNGDVDKLLEFADRYFKHQRDINKCYFLETDRGLKYEPVFKAIRIQHILNDVVSVKTLEADGIIPESWLLSEYRKQWLKMLAVDQRMDPGPVGMSLDHFKAYSVRCGRVLHEPGEYCWRWTGFSFGVDVLVTFNSHTGVVAVKRNTRSQPCVSAVSLAPKRTIKLRFRMTSLEESGEIVSKHDTGVMQINLAQDEESSILSLGPSTQFPFYVSVNMMLTSIDSLNPLTD